MPRRRCAECNWEGMVTASDRDCPMGHCGKLITVINESRTSRPATSVKVKSTGGRDWTTGAKGLFDRGLQVLRGATESIGRMAAAGRSGMVAGVGQRLVGASQPRGRIFALVGLVALVVIGVMFVVRPLVQRVTDADMAAGSYISMPEQEVVTEVVRIDWTDAPHLDTKTWTLTGLGLRLKLSPRDWGGQSELIWLALMSIILPSLEAAYSSRRQRYSRLQLVVTPLGMLAVAAYFLGLLDPSQGISLVILIMGMGVMLNFRMSGAWLQLLVIGLVAGAMAWVLGKIGLGQIDWLCQSFALAFMAMVTLVIVTQEIVDASPLAGTWSLLAIAAFGGMGPFGVVGTKAWGVAFVVLTVMLLVLDYRRKTEAAYFVLMAVMFGLYLLFSWAMQLGLTTFLKEKYAGGISVYDVAVWCLWFGGFTLGWMMEKLSGGSGVPAQVIELNRTWVKLGKFTLPVNQVQVWVVGLLTLYMFGAFV